MINARSESVAEKPAFREAFRKRRCLVTADGFYEWRTDGKSKQPYAVALADGAPMALAGLWEGWRAPDWRHPADLHHRHHRGEREAGGDAPPHAGDPAARRPGGAGWARTRPRRRTCWPCCAPARPEMVAAWPVTPRVNKVAENDAGLLARDPLAVVPAGLDDAPPEFAE